MLIIKTNRFATLFPVLLAFSLVLGLSGCAISPKGAALSESAAIRKAEKAIKEGDFEAAAREYINLASVTGAPKKQEYQLQAAIVLLRGNFIEQAQRVLSAIEEDKLNSKQFFRKRLLSARIALTQHDPAYSLSILDIKQHENMPGDLRADFHTLRAVAYLRLGNLIGAVRERIKLDSLLTDANESITNQQAIWQTLMSLSNPALQQLRSENQGTDISTWIELAYLSRQPQTRAINIEQSVAAWRERFPTNTISEDIIASVLARQEKELLRPMNIAVLLPFTGIYAKPAAVLRDGILIAHYNRDNKAYQPSIHFYDIGDNTRPVEDIYRQVIADGAEFVIGPLSKDQVNRLIRKADFTVPTLTLNYGDDRKATAQNLFQLGLSPEDEARQLAERAWLDGHNQALAFTPQGSWGERLYAAFEEHWTSLGGAIIEAKTYSAKDNDFSGPLKDLLNIDESNKRYQSLRQLLGEDIKFEPRRREDIDFIFMTAFPRQARLIRPQLKFHYASSLPVYATSHVFTGMYDRHADRDIDGIIFCDMPWVLSSPNTDKTKKEIIKLWPDLSEQYLRFYALGIDAYNIIPHLSYMSSYRYEHFTGVTGSLSLDNANRIFRQLQWAQFINGIPATL